MSDMQLPMIKRRRTDRGQERDMATTDFADEDEELDSELVRAHPFAPMLKRFLDNECLNTVEYMRTEGTPST